MKTIYKILLTILAILISCFLIRLKKPQPEVIIKTDTIYSEVIKTKLIPNLVIKEKLISKNDTIYLNDTILQTDTIFIMLDDYLATKFYTDTAFNDSLGLIIINDSLYKNSIRYRHVERKTYDKTKYVYSEKNGLFIGVGITGFKEPIYNIGIDYNFKKIIVGVGINTNEQLLINLKYKINGN